MRQRVSKVALVAVAVALVLLAVPFGVGIRISFFADERTELERAALAAAVQVGPDFTAGDPVELPTPITDGRVAVYDPSLQLRAGSGPPAADRTTRAALAGVVSQGREGGELVVAVPVVSSERVIGVVRASSAVSGVWSRILLAWLAVAGSALVALVIGLAVAVRQARRLSRPLESLAAVARSVADGDLTARAGTSGIPEIDEVAGAQNTMVNRLATVLEHGRHFAAEASHQLRTPLAGLRLVLESAVEDPSTDRRKALAEALRQSAELQRTVEEVLALTQLTPPETGRLATVDELILELRHRWHTPLATHGRRLELVVADQTAQLRVPYNLCLQVLDVLIDNARAHGRGTVRVTARNALGALAVDVADEGNLPAHTPDLFQRVAAHPTGSGIGLPLAHSLAESHGGRLTLRTPSPTTFTLLIPID